MAKLPGFACLCVFLFIESFKNHFLSQALSTNESDNLGGPGGVPVRDYVGMTNFAAARRVEARLHLPQDIPVDLEVPKDVLAIGACCTLHGIHISRTS